MKNNERERSDGISVGTALRDLHNEQSVANISSHESLDHTRSECKSYVSPAPELPKAEALQISWVARGKTVPRLGIAVGTDY